MIYGKPVEQLASLWHKKGWPDADARKAAYLLERAAAYQRIVDAHLRMGTTVPPSTILSGEG